MAKTIIVCGSAGAGKTVFSCILATSFAIDNKKVLIISLDYDIPMNPVILPEQDNSGSSIKSLLEKESITTVDVASAILISKKLPMIGVLGFNKNEVPMEYREIESAKVMDILTIASGLVDIMIWDGVSDICAVEIYNALFDYADMAVQIITPDLKGIYYNDCFKRCFPQTDSLAFMVFAGMARPYHALEEVSYKVGKLDGLLPFSKELDRCITEGYYFAALSHCHKDYIESIDKVIDRLGDKGGIK